LEIIPGTTKLYSTPDVNEYLLPSEIVYHESYSFFNTAECELTPEQLEQILKVLNTYRDLFDLTSPGRTSVIRHEIRLEDNHPITLKPYYRKSPLENDFLEKEINKMLEEKIISPSESPWSAPVVIVKKKNGKFRLCVDYRRLNSITKRDQYPLPRIDELLDSFKNARYFLIIDLVSGFWQVEMQQEDRQKTAFITKQGLFEFNIMPFGLTNAPATFQRLMNTIFREYIDKFIVVYIDDITIYSKTFDEHLQHLRSTFTKLREAGLKVQPDKCQFGKTSLSFLGYIIGKNGIKPDPSKVEKVQDYPVPNNLTTLR